MKTTLVAVLLVIFLGASSPATPSQSPDATVIKDFISRQAAKEGGEEYEEARKVIEGDLDGDGAADLAVLYTIEGQNGTNNHIQYLAVFVRVKGRLVPVTHTAIGGKSNRAVELQSISKQVIMLATLTYAAKDAACCPSKKGEARYVLLNRKLKELKSAPPRRS